jgi:hypothetical protein
VRRSARHHTLLERNLKGLSRDEARDTTRDLSEPPWPGPPPGDHTRWGRARLAGLAARAGQPCAGRARAQGEDGRRERGEGEEGKLTTGLDGWKQPLTGIHPRAGREVEERERDVFLHGKETMWGGARMGEGSGA